MPDLDMAQFTGVFRAGKPNRVRRNRQPVSCVACQRRKSRCDKRGEGDGCRFGPTAAAAAAAAAARARGRFADAEEVGAGAEAASAAVVDDEQKAIRSSEQTAQPHHGATAWSAVVSSIQDIQHMLQADFDAELESKVRFRRTTRRPGCLRIRSIRSTAFTDCKLHHHAPHHARAHVPEGGFCVLAPPLPERVARHAACRAAATARRAPEALPRQSGPPAAPTRPDARHANQDSAHRPQQGSTAAARQSATIPAP
ncbi:hypothetical protein MY10362_005530 [Beauveria mimosiformis]